MKNCWVGVKQQSLTHPLSPPSNQSGCWRQRSTNIFAYSALHMNTAIWKKQSEAGFIGNNTSAGSPSMSHWLYIRLIYIYICCMIWNGIYFYIFHSISCNNVLFSFYIQYLIPTKWWPEPSDNSAVYLKHILSNFERIKTYSILLILV